MARTHGHGAVELSAIKVLTKRGTEVVGRTLVMNPRNSVNQNYSIQGSVHGLG